MRRRFWGLRESAKHQRETKSVGEAKQKMRELRDRMLWQAEGWCFAPSAWERELVGEIVQLPAHTLPRMPTKDIEWMGMPASECHANTRWYERNDPTKRSKSVTGWWLQGMEFILHSVLGCNGQYMCITPTPRNESEIRFFPDSKIEWFEAGEFFTAFRNGREVGIGVRRFPAFTVAQNSMMRERLLSGMNPHRASEFSLDEMNALLRENLTPEEFALVGYPTTDLNHPQLLQC
jgi:hypothetical protein